MKKGFTLIELLIVVAIIGILSAIAVPNFMNAQVRAKLARNFADLRTLHTGVEQLRIDTGALPIDVWDYQTSEGKAILKETFNNVGAVSEMNRTPDLILAVLTSPVPYITAVPMDPFLKNAGNPEQRGFEVALTTYVYVDEDPKIPGQDLFLYPIGHRGADEPSPFAEGEFALLGAGPDGILGNRTTVEGNTMRGLPYDVSNGLRSVGDIFVLCPNCLE
jgi:prepilin-type N-terminal cleavage/methylation domain-containing protein